MKGLELSFISVQVPALNRAGMKSECHICLSILITVVLVGFLFLKFPFSVQLSCHFCSPGDRGKLNFNVLKLQASYA